MNEYIFPQDMPMMPRVFRLTDIISTETEQGHTMTAQLYHDRASLTATWTARHPDVRLRSGVLVSPRWVYPMHSEDGKVRVSRLALLERPERSENLFRIIPPRFGWQTGCYWTGPRRCGRGFIQISRS